MDIQTFAAQASRFFDDVDGPIVTPVDGMILFRRLEQSPLEATLYEPVVCLVLQGEKETSSGETKVTLRPGDSLVVSHDVPVVSQITQASESSPYLAVILSLDVALLHELQADVEHLERPPGERLRALAKHPSDPRLVDALSRYLELAHDPNEAKIMLPLLKKEVHFRLLTAPHGGMLRSLLKRDGNASNIAAAIAIIREKFRETIAIPDLAREVGMSASSLHRHFKQITETTPLQYQKELRLLEARRLLSAGGGSVTGVANDVGYESPNQFSREYSRKFGVPPREDLVATG